MLHLFDFARELSFFGVTVRLLLAAVCGGCIGVEREFKRRPAGFRTHILICVGAAMTTLTSQYLLLEMQMFTDVARLGAQVVAGIGFIGAGTIIVTNRSRVRGLTTAAGLWTAAIIGLVSGAGYIEGAAFATAMVLLAELVLIRIEYRFAKKREDVSLYIEYGKPITIQTIVELIRNEHITLSSLEITRSAEETDNEHCCAVLVLHAGHSAVDQKIIKPIASMEDVFCLEEL